MSKKQTAVEYLFQLIDDFGIKKIDRKAILELEKQQIIDAYEEGFTEANIKVYSEDYYNQTYGKDEQH